MTDLKNELSKLIQTFNSKRVISEGEIQDVLKAIIIILAENKKGVENLNAETKKQLEQAITYISNEHNAIINKLTSDLTQSRQDIEKATKAQNDRAFQRLQELMGKVKLFKNGLNGKNGDPGQPGSEGAPGRDGSPDTPFQIRDKLEVLRDNDRLDASAIKNLPKWIERKGKQLIVGGIRFLEQLADVSIVPTKKRQDLMIQYSTTNNRWENGIALTVSTIAPTNPQINDLWVDIS